MKKILSIFTIILSLFLFIACSTTDNKFFIISGPDSLNFTININESNTAQLKEEIESNFYITDQEGNRTSIHSLSFNYDGVLFNTTGTNILIISILDDSNNILADQKNVIINLNYHDIKDPNIEPEPTYYYNINIYLDYTNNQELYDVIELEAGLPILINLPDVFLEGFNFTYWSTDLLGNNIITSEDTINTNLSVYANWDKENSPNHKEYLDIFYINDLHGRVFHEPANNILGISNIYQFILDYEQQEDTEAVIILGGDIFQGTLISAHSKGELLIEIFNKMGVDALVLGNHEFDWGINEITKYFDNSNNSVKANFPLLGTNAIYKDTFLPIDGITNYNLINKNNINIGIIGTIDSGLESSIMENKVSDYYFKDPTVHTKNLARELREEKDANIVISSIHGGSTSVNYYFNETIKSYSGNELIDISLNAHSHRRYQGVLSRNHSYNLIAMQSGSYGSNLGHIKLQLDNNKNIINHTINQYYPNEAKFSKSNAEIDNIINNYYQEVAESYTKPIINVSTTISSNSLASYISRISREYTNSDVGLQNNGGTRSDIYAGVITHANIYQTFPFDNQVISVLVEGSLLRSYINSFGSNVSYRPGINSSSDLKNGVYYKVAVNEYIFAFSSNPFIKGDEITYYGAQDIIMKETVEKLADLGYQTFTTNHPNVWENSIISNNYSNYQSFSLNYLQYN